jgi:curli production assembly/transport component CsgE
MKLTCHLCVAIVLAFALPAAAFADERGSDAIENLLVNQTVTVAGQEFHAAFAAMWSDQGVVADSGLAIRERPSARRGTMIEVEHANRIVFSAILPPARVQVRPLAEQAVRIVHEIVIAKQVQQLLRDDDLAPDEL